MTDQEKRDDAIKFLKTVTPQSPELMQINGKQYKRYNVVVEKLKLIRGYKCQICGIGIEKINGDRYVEGAHIISKKDGGSETPHNIVLLCPNHHKEFDKGKKEIIRLGNCEIILKLNDVESPIINLSVE